MKRCVLIVGIVVWSLAIFSCQVRETGPRIFFECLDYDFGEKPNIDTLFFEFKFRNIGQKDLIINKVKTQCICTVASWTHEPVKNSEFGSILISYKASFPTAFKEVIYVYHNGENSPTRLSVKGKILTDD
jgi:hypothetical protein